MGNLAAAIVTVTPFQQNCTLLWDDETKRGVVIDPGGELQRIEEAIAEVGMVPEKILLTHGHIDHAGGAEALKKKLDVSIVGPHRADEELLNNIESQSAMFGVPGEFANAYPDEWLDEGDTISIGGHDFEVLHCPGHSPGHLVFYNRAHKFAHVGDVLFSGSIGRTDLPGGDTRTLLRSIRDQILSLPGDTILYSGHGPATTVAREAASNPFLVGLGEE